MKVKCEHRRCKVRSGCKHYAEHEESKHCKDIGRCFPKGFETKSVPASCKEIKQ